MLLQIEKLRFAHCGPIDLCVEKDECIAISGESGSGKSLLLRAIADLDPHEGSALLDETSCLQMAAHLWRQRVTLLPAESQWWHDSVGEHFKRVDHPMLEKLGFNSDALQWSVARLSSGEKQRLALLRCLQLEPDVLLLDEPTANLDERNTQVFESLVQDYLVQHHACAIWVSHDMSQLARIARRHFRIHNGLLELQAC